MPERNSFRNITPEIRTPFVQREGIVVPRKSLPSFLRKYNEAASDTGLIVVIEPTKSLEVAQAADMPQEEQVEKPEPRVPLTVWLTTPLGALTRLAEETSNHTVTHLLKVKKEKQKIKEEIIEDRNEISQKDRFYAIDKRMQRELVESDLTSEEKIQQHKEGDEFVATTIREISTLTGTKEHTGAIEQITEVVDMLRFQTKTMQIPAAETVEAIIETGEGKVSKPMLDLLTRFAIPPSLAGELLPMMDKSGQLAHPLAWHLLDRLPDDHPFKQKQIKNVEDIKDLLTGDITPTNLRLAKALSEHIVSVYVTPETDNPEDKVGLEFENTPLFEGVSVPEGTTLGQDTNINSVGELRLDNKKEVLQYGKTWRERYYQIYLWSQATQATESSLHVHINQQQSTNLELYKMIFGFGDDRVKRNDIGTVEVKGTALAGYNNNIDEGAKGFSSVFMPDFVELLFSLRDQQLPQLDLTTIPEDRFSYFTKLVKDPTSRAAMLVASKGEAGLQVRNPKNLAGGMERRRDLRETLMMPNHRIIEAINTNNEDALDIVVERLNQVDPSLHNKILKFAITAENKWMLECLARNMALLETKSQTTLVDYAIDNHDSRWTRMVLRSLPLIEASQRDRLVNIAIEDGSNEALDNIIPYMNLLTRDQQEKVIGIYSTSKSASTGLLGHHIDKVDVQFHDSIVELIMGDRNANAMIGLAKNIGMLQTHWQIEVVSRVISQSSNEHVKELSLQQIATNIDELPERIQRTFLSSIEYEYPRLYKIATSNIRNWTYRK